MLERVCTPTAAQDGGCSRFSFNTWERELALGLLGFQVDCARGSAAHRLVDHRVPRAHDKGQQAVIPSGGGGGERKCQLQTFPPISSARAEEMHLEPSVLCQLLASADCKGQLGRSHRAEHSNYRNGTCEHDLKEQQTSDAGVT